MKKIVIAALAMSLLACNRSNLPPVNTEVGVVPPALPANLGKKAGQLPPITDNTMGGSQIQGAKDDSQYNAVAWQLNAVIDVYNCVRTAIQNHTDVKTCL